MGNQKVFGVVTRYADHVGQFRPAFWEVKDVGGAHREPVAGSIPMVSCFADNRVAKAHPEWVQVGPGGQRATRDQPYFDWDCLCPSRPEVEALALEWVRDAAAQSGPEGFRLDDVTFAREGYCQCAACEAGRRKAGLDLETYRMARLADFVARARSSVAGKLYFTLFPDPYPGHLERRFGIDVDRMKQWVDVFVVPIYDLAYTTTYWLEVLAQGFQDRLGGHPWYLELYGLGVEEAKLVKASRVGASYADGVLIAYENDLDKLRRIQEALVG
ncbi:hypothetical protein [Kyrpidia spormannii]|uniref:DUF4838 domain-containing protein n=2 Tax=Kyrpidia spormannii TaxID=2055160 RepID=A0A6F9EAW5_9BACL|nr:hypothetical protein [Kyrpidia spormannii]CAB3394007.1 conserved protein of unknown function [Kyrpidia spormannii]CAB3394945.1 conserved protein of unknown function [Kyrpidia spormannii]